jgi:hypothetical protein
MYASRRLFVNARSAKAVACAIACASLAACTSRVFSEGEIDPASPVKDEIAATARANADYPAFTEVPAKPNDIRPVLAFGQAANKLIADRDAMARDTAPDTWTLTTENTAAFAAAANKAAGPELPAVTNTDTDAYAASLRRRATPPPPPKR